MGDKELYGQFADASYNYDLSVGDPLKFAPSYTVIAVSHSGWNGNWSGYDGFAAFSWNGGKCNVVVGNAGTDPSSILDVSTDVELTSEGTNNQVGDSIKLTKMAVTAARSAGCETVTVVQTGHSLGGETSAENVKAIGGEAFAYNAPGSYGFVYGNLLSLIGINGVANVHYIDSETDGLVNWLITSLGQRSAPASGNQVGLAGGTFVPVDRSEVPGTVGHESAQLVRGLVDPLAVRIERQLEVVTSEFSEALRNMMLVAELAYGAHGGRIPVGGLLELSESGPDLTSQAARRIGIDAYVKEQQLAAARADAAINGHHPDDGGGSDRDPSPTTGSGGGTKSTVASTCQTAATSQADYNQNYDRDRQSGTTYSAQAQDPYRSGVQPILLDLNGNGVEIATLDRSATFLDSSGDGLQHRTAWAGTGDGVLFYDAGNDGKISETREYVFTEWDPTAKDDMAALRARFDTSGGPNNTPDGKLTSADAAWSSFKVMVSNADGSQSAKTLTELGITEINLVPNATHVAFDDGSEITGQTTFTMGGVTHVAAAVTLVAEADGHQVVQTVSSTGADNRTVVSVTSDAAGHVLEQVKSVVTGIGSATVTTTNSYDDNGDGAFDRVQVISRATDGAGVVTETVADYRGASTTSGVLQDKVETVRGADGASVRIARDTKGGGWTDEVESRQIAGGALTTKLWEVAKADSPSGTADPTHWTSLKVETVSADGLTRTVKLDADGVVNGAGTGSDTLRTYYDTVESHVIAGTLAATRTETISITNNDGSLRSGSVLTTTGGGQTNVTAYDRDGNGVVDLRVSKAITLNADGSSVATEKVYGDATNAALLRQVTETTTSADALTVTTKVDLNGDSSGTAGWEQTRLDATVVNADGSRIETVTVTNADGSLREKTLVSLAADKLGSETKVDLNRNGTFDATDLVKSVVVSGTGAAQVVTATAWDRNMDGSVNGRTVEVTSNSGLTKVTTVYQDADATADLVISDTFSTVGSGASATYLEVIDSRNSDSKSRGTVEKVTSADGLTVTTWTDRDHHVYTGGATPAFDVKSLDVTVLGGNGVDTLAGAVTETVSQWAVAAEYDATGTITASGPEPVLLSKVVTEASADRLNSRVTADTNGDGNTDSVTTHVTATDGTKTVTDTTYAANGTLLGSQVQIRSANGLTLTAKSDRDGVAGFETVTLDATVIGADGSRTRSVVTRDGDGGAAAIRSQSQTVVSDDGLTVTTKTDVNGDANLTTGTGFDRIQMVQKTYQTDGTEKTLTSSLAQNGTLLGRSETVLSNDGLTSTVRTDADGNGSFDLISTTVKTLLANGGVTVSATQASVAGAFLASEVTTTSDDGRHVTDSRSLYGAGSLVEVVQQDEAANGTVTTTDKMLAAGVTLSQTKVVQLGDGSQVTKSTDSDGNGTYERIELDTVVLQADGTRVVRQVSQLANGTAFASLVREASDDHLTSKVTQDVNGDGTIDAQEVTCQTVSSSGVTTVTVDHYAGGAFASSGAQGLGANLIDHLVTVTSADGRTVTTAYDQDFNGNADKSVSRVLGNDGGATTTTVFYSSGGTAVARDVVVVNASGTARTETVDRNNDARPEQVIREVTSTDAFGTSDRITEHLNDRNVLIGREEYIASDDGLFTSATLDLDGDGILDLRSEVLTTWAADGDILREAETFDENSNRVSYVATRTSGNGLQTQQQADYDGDGSFDRLSTVQKSADGSWASETRLFGVGTDAWRTVRETMSFDGRDHSIETDQDGDLGVDIRVHA